MKSERELKENRIPTNLRRYVFWWLYPYGWVPLAWRQDCHLIEEFINPSDQIVAVFSFIGNIMENLRTTTIIGKVDEPLKIHSLLTMTQRSYTLTHSSLYKRSSLIKSTHNNVCMTKFGLCQSTSFPPQ